jgi:GDP-L-fucose synthase
LNDDLNNEYTSNNNRVVKEIKELTFTSHKDAITKMRGYFSYNLENLDKNTIINDPYLKKIENMWKGK